MSTIFLEDEKAQSPLDMYLRVQSGAFSSTSSEVHSLAIALVKDVLAAKLKADADLHAPGFMHAHGFSDAERALAASRAVQVSLAAFAQTASDSPGVAVVLDAAEGNGNARDLTAVASPFQILVTQAFRDRLEQSHLLPLRAVPGRNGVYEFLWASEQRLAELQRHTGSDPTVHIPQTQPGMVATRFNDETRFNNETYFLQPEDRDDSRVAEVTTPSFGGLGALDTEEPRRRSKSRGGWVIAAIVLVIAGLGYGATATQTGKDLVKQVRLLIDGPNQTAPQPPTGAASDQEANSGAAPKAVAPISTPTPLATPPPPVQHVPRCNVPTNLVPGKMALAKTYYNQGEFADALRIYSALQGCGAAARDGLQQAKRALSKQGASNSE